jgi:hypothetical protein
MKGRPDHLGDPSDVHGSEWPGRQETRLESRSIPILQKSNRWDNIPDQELGTLKTLQEAFDSSALFQAILPIRMALEGDRTVQ